MSKYERIYIVGHSGAGKGVLAKALAKKLGWKFIDADFGLSPSIGRSLKDIIGTQGEVLFHQCLTDILSSQKTMEHIVVTTDDSIVCTPKNQKLLSSDFVVWLQVSPDVQLERIGHNRPLIPRSDYEAFLNTQRKERDDLYSQVADFSISSDDGDIDSHVVQIINAIDSSVIKK